MTIPTKNILIVVQHVLKHALILQLLVYSVFKLALKDVSVKKDISEMTMENVSIRMNVHVSIQVIVKFLSVKNKKK